MDIRKKKLPIGIEDFEKLRKEDFYYIDKTGLIKELLNNWGEVNLFTRPRRFGKSLNMSMLKCFFEPESDKNIFEDLEIGRDRELCEKYMGKFPVISVSLKGINADSYEKACRMAAQIINGEARRLQYLLESNQLTQYDKDAFSVLLRDDMDEPSLCYSLKTLSELLQKHHDSKVILLIDEYDVPLAKAFEQGFYDQMVLLIRNLFEQVLKTNSSLQFAVLSGCMRISKESIFTGLNNLRVLSVADVDFDEYYGFTDEEVRNLLEYYQLSSSYGTIKEWYDGYRFGSVEVYCPWDVICYCSKLRTDRDARPENYWSNTSSNDAVRHFLQESDKGTTKREIERLVAGEVIAKEIHQELTYKDMYDSVENIWSVLFTTGYLTQRGKPEGNSLQLAIPNMEIRKIFTTQIMDYFKQSVQKNGKALDKFCEALKNGDAGGVEKQLNEYLRKTISIRDTFVKKQMKENFYHGILLGLLGFKDSWSVSSNKESGDGYSDILVEIEEESIGIVLEVKYPEDGNLEAGCRAALEQIEKKGYVEELRDEGMEQILKYGIACYKKRCGVMLAVTGQD
ncbi:MAG: AAA family ATPase [Blautia sp.]|uniref:AAA family ATPase n=1 Tax=Blautia sp. NSJ-175 TaxID=2931396 RepID=UPI001FD24733|nr:AAA family ATPase [Blautia sp. NSJ-175]MCJ7847496.1 ATP-binding protein [Blautia sp. NSJ-175]